jgi:hypothetical protein
MRSRFEPGFNERHMYQAGRAHWLTIAGLASLLVVAGLFFFGQDRAGKVAHAFMTALGEGDVDALVQHSFYPGASSEELRDRWKFAVERAGPNYRFAWRIVGITKASEETAAAVMMVVRNPGPTSFEEKIQLPLQKEKGEWKVDVRAIDRKLYPALPR